MNLNLEVVARTAWKSQGSSTAPKLIALAERPNERQRNFLRVWPCRRLRTVRGGAEDGLEETLVREWTATGLVTNIEAAAFLAGIVKLGGSPEFAYGQSQEVQTTRAVGQMARPCHQRHAGKIH